jgi:bacteriocin-like protein
MSTEISELTDTELDAVSGGGSGTHIQDAIIETFGGGGGGGTSGTTPAGAWNACLKVFGYGAQA